MSSLEFASQENHEDNNNERLHLLLKNNMDPTATINMLLPTQTFLRAAISLKDQVVEVMWRRGGCGVRAMGTDPTLYKGLLGTAFICLRSYEITGDRHDLQLSSEIIDACASVARASASILPCYRHVTFLCGRGGIYALGAVVANHKGDHQRRDFFLNLFLEIFDGLWKLMRDEKIMVHILSRND